MNDTTIGLIIAFLWLASGVLQWGLMYAYFTRKYPNLPEARTSHIWFAFTGPMALLSALACLLKFNGFKKAFMYGFKL
jgi:hypothetical protein